MIVQYESDFPTLLNDASTFLNMLSVMSRNYNQSISSASEILMGLNFGSWNDNVGQKVSSYVQSLGTGVGAIDADINGGAFTSLCKLTEALCNSLSSCGTYKSNYSNIVSRISSMEQYFNQNPTAITNDVQKNYSDLVYEAKSLESKINAGISDCNNIIAAIHNVLFNASVEVPQGSAPAEIVDGEGSDEEIPFLEVESLDQGSGVEVVDPYAEQPLEEGYQRFHNAFNDESEVFFVAHEDFNDGQGEVDHYFRSKDAYNQYKSEAEMLDALRQSKETGQPVTVTIDYEGQPKQVDVYYEYGNIPDHLDLYLGKSWASESASHPGFEDGAKVFPVDSWDADLSQVKFSFDVDGDTYEESGSNLVYQWGMRL